MTQAKGPVLSNWQVRQWATIQRLQSYTVCCRLCEWADGALTRTEAEDLYRLHWRRVHEG